MYEKIPAELLTGKIFINVEGVTFSDEFLSNGGEDKTYRAHAREKRHCHRVNLVAVEKFIVVLHD